MTPPLLTFESPSGKRTIINSPGPLDDQMKKLLREYKDRGFVEVRRGPKD